jgi:hypothetical protein
MFTLEIIGLCIFIILTFLGYKKNNRNIMLFASMCLLVSLSGPDFISGFIEGYHQ